MEHPKEDGGADLNPGGKISACASFSDPTCKNNPRVSQPTAKGVGLPTQIRNSEESLCKP